MKNLIKLEIKPQYREDGFLDRENSICIDIDEYVPERRKTPSDRVIKELREQKKIIKHNRFYPPEDNHDRYIEYSIGQLASQHKRRKFREQQIQEIIKLLQKIQNDRHILSFTRRYIDDILKSYSKLSERVRSSIVSEIIKRGKEREAVKTFSVLVDIPHYEHRLKNEKITSKNYGINKEWIRRNKIIKTYSFT